jgi:hypothetical protein
MSVAELEIVDAIFREATARFWRSVNTGAV